MPPTLVPAMYTAAADAVNRASISSWRYVIASAGSPPRASPSRNRTASSTCRNGLNAANTPKMADAAMAARMALSRPKRSAAHDHGTTASATPSIAKETVSATSLGGAPRSALSTVSSACGEWSWAKVATPAAPSPTRMRRYSRDSRWCPAQSD